MTKKCIAAGKAINSTVYMTVRHDLYDDQLTETCPNPDCGHPQGPVSGNILGMDITYFYDCSEEGCGAVWMREETFSPANATVVGGDSDGNIYTSTFEALS
jgi:hypothetical protein